MATAAATTVAISAAVALRVSEGQQTSTSSSSPRLASLKVPNNSCRCISRVQASLSSSSPAPSSSSSLSYSQEAASSSSAAIPVPTPPRQAPLIHLEFIAPDNRPGENEPIPGPQYCTAVSGEKLLRDVMLENQIELYGPFGKMMNCEGRGMCGTCLVDILEGAELMNKRTSAEPYYLKLRPDSWRLACQATVGDGTNGGKIKVKRRPQKGNPLM